jgi:hypothetical protein
LKARFARDRAPKLRAVAFAVHLSRAVRERSKKGDQQYRRLFSGEGPVRPATCTRLWWLNPGGANTSYR